jgi:hypothetical protein
LQCQRSSLPYRSHSFSPRTLSLAPVQTRGMADARSCARYAPACTETVVRGRAGSAGNEGESSSSTDDALQDLARNRDNIVSAR